jgi:hypothetical protein
MKIDLKSLVNTPVIEEISHTFLDKAMHIKLKVDETLQLILSQKDYSFFLR